MPGWEEEAEVEFEWVDEEECEVPDGAGSSLARIRRPAVAVFLGLLGLAALAVIVKLASFFI